MIKEFLYDLLFPKPIISDELLSLDELIAIQKRNKFIFLTDLSGLIIIPIISIFLIYLSSYRDFWYIIISCILIELVFLFFSFIFFIDIKQRSEILNMRIEEHNEKVRIINRLKGELP